MFALPVVCYFVRVVEEKNQCKSVNEISPDRQLPNLKTGGRIRVEWWIFVTLECVTLWQENLQFGTYLGNVARWCLKENMLEIGKYHQIVVLNPDG